MRMFGFSEKLTMNIGNFRSERTKQVSVSPVTIKRYFERFAEKGPAGFGDRMFKPQGRFPAADGGKVLVHAFKAYQFRIYGVVRDFRGRRSFVGTTCDPKKKQNKANPKKLKQAAVCSTKVK